MIDDDYEKEILAKILILGDSKVGKSSILTRFTEGYWSPNTVATLGTLLIQNSNNFLKELITK